MPTPFVTSYELGDTILPNHSLQYAEPINRLESAAAYYGEGESSEPGTYAVTLTPAPSTYTAGMLVNFKADQANSGPATLSVNGLSAIPLVVPPNQPLQGGEIQAGQVVSVIFDGDGHFQLRDAASSLSPALVSLMSTAARVYLSRFI